MSIGIRPLFLSGHWQEVSDLREQDENNSVGFSDLTSEITLHHLYNSLVVT